MPGNHRNAAARAEPTPAGKDRSTRDATEAKSPILAIVVEVAEVYFHCGRALVRSRLWDPASQALADELPSAGEVGAEQFGVDAELLSGALEAAYRWRQYAGNR